MLLFSSKAEELKNLIQNEHILWISQYLVMKRASIEPNFHQLYLEFMESLELSNFAREVLKETYRNIKVGCKERCEQMPCFASEELELPAVYGSLLRLIDSL